jgi:hypothetical protein
MRRCVPIMILSSSLLLYNGTTELFSPLPASSVQGRLHHVCVCATAAVVLASLQPFLFLVKAFLNQEITCAADEVERISCCFHAEVDPV